MSSSEEESATLSIKDVRKRFEDLATALEQARERLDDISGVVETNTVASASLNIFGLKTALSPIQDISISRPTLNFKT